MEKNCPFCDVARAESRVIHEYHYWSLFIQPLEKRMRTKGSAGFLASKVHIVTPDKVSNEAWAELRTIIKDSSLRLCAESKMTYMNAETVGFNQGTTAGQTVDHAHVHVLPSVKEDPPSMRVRGGIGGAFEALRKSSTNT